MRRAPAEQSPAMSTPRPATPATPATHATWMDLDGPALDRAYSPSSVAPDFLHTLRAYGARSDAVRASLGGGEAMRYGPGGRENVWLYDAAPADAPLLVFFHGGYWQEGDARDALFPAPALLASGIAYASIGYELAPDAGVDDIVSRCAVALALLLRRYRERHPGARAVLSGSSAGAHLAASMMGIDWRTHGFDATPFSATVLLSGVYDLRPLVATYINAPLGMDQATALRCSPLFAELPAAVPSALCWGERETAEFCEQSHRMGERLNQAGVATRLIEIVDRDHFDIVFDLSDPLTPLGREVRRQLEKPE